MENRPTALTQPSEQLTAGGLLKLAVYVLSAAGLTLALATTRTGHVGSRVCAIPPVAVGYLLAVVLVSLTAPPWWGPFCVGLAWLAVVRHRLHPSPGFSYGIGDGLVPGFGGRLVVGGLAVAAGLLIRDRPTPAYGLGTWLVLAGGGQAVLFTTMRLREGQQDRDARDGLALARLRAGRAGLS